MVSSVTPLHRNAVVAPLDAALPNHARLPIMAQSPCEPTEAERPLRGIAACYGKTAPKLAAWLEENVPEALAVLRIPAAYRRRLTITPTATRKTTSNTVYETA